MENGIIETSFLFPEFRFKTSILWIPSITENQRIYWCSVVLTHLYTVLHLPFSVELIVKCKVHFIIMWIDKRKWYSCGNFDLY